MKHLKNLPQWLHGDDKMSKEDKSLDKIVRKIGRGLDKAKKFCEPWIDEALLFAALNSTAAYGILEMVDRSNLSDPANDIIMLGAGAAVAAADYFMFFSPKTKYLRKQIGKLNRKVDDIRPLSWIKTAALTAGLIYGASGIKPYVAQLKDDISSKIQAAKETEQILPGAPGSPTRAPAEVTLKITGQPPKPIDQLEINKDLRSRPKVYNSLGYINKISHDFSGVQLAHKGSDIGRIQRVLRWQPIYNTIEKARGLKKNTLAGMIMQESYGDPVQPNMRDDGGLGLMHEQGPTAKAMGLGIHGDSKRASDRRHGIALKKMIEECKYDPTCIHKFDERVHPIKNLDTGARIIIEGMLKYDSKWESGVEYFRAPGKVGRNLTWKYMDQVRDWMSRLENPELLKKAAIDFEQRNGYSLKSYLGKWHDMNNNWGLNTYVQEMPGILYPARSIVSELPDVVVDKIEVAKLKPKPAPSQEQWVTYTAKPGDTVFGITHRTAQDRVTAEQFRKQNNVYDDKIVPNQKYKLYKSR